MIVPLTRVVHDHFHGKTITYWLLTKAFANRSMIAESLFRSRHAWRFVVLASLVLLALHWGGDATRTALAYGREPIQAGEWLRLVTGHWVHLNGTHVAMNIAGLWLLALLDIEDGAPSAYLLRSAVLSLAVGVMLYVLEPGLYWYVGLSGVLHGLFVIVLFRSIYPRRDLLALVALLLLLVKLIWEHYHGALMQGTLDAPVIVSAHSYGALAGFAYALVESIHDRMMSHSQAGHPSDHERK